MSEPTSPTPMKTLIVVVLDESGSMNIQKSDVTGGYNSFLDTQLEITEDLGRLVLIKFNHNVSVAHSATALKDVPKLDNSNYSPRGCTALYDAVAEGIRIGEGAVQKDERVLVLIMTDGEENASRKATGDEVKAMIDSHEKLGNWTFAYIGQNPEGWAKTVGKTNTTSNVMSYNMTKQRQNFSMASIAVQQFRQQPQCQQIQGFFPTDQFRMSLPPPPTRQVQQVPAASTFRASYGPEQPQMQPQLQVQEVSTIRPSGPQEPQPPCKRSKTQP